MNKIYIVSGKNEKDTSYQIKKIVYFYDNQSPKTVDYENVHDLVNVVEYAKENGFDLLNGKFENAIKSDFIHVISTANEKELSKLKEIIIEEEKKHMDVSTGTNDNKVDLLDEEKAFAEYLRLNILRAKNQLDKEQTLEIEKLRKSNTIINELEALRNAVIEAAKRVQLLKNKNLEEIRKAENELKVIQKVYDDTFDYYRNKFASSIKDNDVDNTENHYENESADEKSLAKNNSNPFETRNKVSVEVYPEDTKEDQEKNTEKIKQDEVVENNTKQQDESEEEKKGFVLVNDKKEKNAEDINIRNEEEIPVEVEGNTFLVKITNKIKAFFINFGAIFFGIVSGVKEFLDANNATVEEKKNSTQSVKEEAREIKMETINTSVEDKKGTSPNKTSEKKEEQTTSPHDLKQELLELRRAAVDSSIDNNENDLDNKTLIK